VPGDVRVAYARDDRREIEVAPVPPGIVVLPNDRLGSPEFPKIARAEARVREALAAAAAVGPHLDEALLGVLADHALPDPEKVLAPPGSRFPPETLRALQALCIHLPFYGTVSSTALLYGPDGRVERYLYADGPPCVTPYADVAALLAGG
jgi:uncharacterized protein with NRDE domain